MGMENCLTVDEGRLGGLALLLRKEIDLSIKSYSRNHIDVVVIFLKR